jgi:hypothetical protein
VVVTGDIKLLVIIVMLMSMFMGMDILPVIDPAVVDLAVAVSVVAVSVALVLQCPFIEIREHTHLPLPDPKRESTLPKNHIAIATIIAQQAIAVVWTVVPYNPLSNLRFDPLIPPPLIPQPPEDLLNQQDIDQRLLPFPFVRIPQPTPPKQQRRQK